MSYEPCSSSKFQTADRTLLIVSGIGSVKVEPVGLLTHVLHVSKLFASLVSVQRLAKFDEFKIIFNGIDAFMQ